MSCNQNKPCGCKEQPLTTAPPCDNTGACEKEPCSEMFCEECIVHCQPAMSIAVGNNTLSIPQGARLDEVIQRMLLFMADPTCVDTAPKAIRIIHKTSTSIRLRWIGPADGAYAINITDGITPNVINTVASTDWTISNLVPGTEYTIYIENTNVSCSSVVLTVTTLI